ncbi:MAG TPA: DUF4388 domain-containing protein, partial [Nitrospirae bacterium]|nr:DUF4388 domain-containing protein [Nitrospirota bacterium]
MYNLIMSDEDRRHFKRYESRSECEVKVGSETYRGRVLDYSDGLGAVFENAPKLTVGTQADVKVFDPEIQFRGEVAWVNKTDDELRVGFKRLDSLQGSLKSFALADVLIGLQRSTKTGVLRVASGSVIKEVFIRNGDMIFASSNYKEDGFGELLVRQKRISQEEFDKARGLSEESGSKLGKVLVELGCLKPKEVFVAVQHQIEEIILSLFAMETGKFRFHEGSLSSDDLITLRISAANIICNGIKNVNNILHIKKVIPPLTAVLDLSPSPMNIFQDVKLDGSDKAILSCIDGKRSLKTVLSLSLLPEPDTLKTICALLSIGMIAVRKEERAPAELKIEDVEEIIKEPAEEITPEFLNKVEDILKKLWSIGYYGILGTEKNASAEEISKAYYSKSKEFHPDRHFALPSDDQDDLKGKLTAIFSYITEAHEHLSDPGRKAEYDRTLLPEAVEIEEAAKEKAAKLAEEEDAKEKAAKLAEEEAAKEKAAKLAEEEAAKEKAAKLAEEEAAKEKAAKLAEEEAAKEKAAKLAEEEAARKKAAKLAEEEAAKEKAAKLAEE